MRKNCTKVTVLISAVIFAVSAMAIPGAAKISGKAAVASVKGEVTVKRAGGGDWEPLKAGAFVGAGDKIKTGPGALCEIRWNKVHAVEVKPLTTLTVSSLDRDPAGGSEISALDVSGGQVLFKAGKMKSPRSTYEIKTPTSVAGIRGTSGAVLVDESGASKVMCGEGSVSVKGSGGGEAVVSAGEKTSVSKEGKTGSVEKITAEEAESLHFSGGAGAGGDSRLDVSSPGDGLVTRDSSVMVSGTLTAGGAVFVNGTLMKDFEKGRGAAFSFPVQLASEGENIITISVNQGGKTGTVTRKVIRDSSSPEIMVYQPAGGSFQPGENGCEITDSSVECVVTGHVDAGSSLTVNGRSCAVAVDGTFSCDVTLGLTDNSIVLTAMDAAGNTSTVLIRSGVDLTRVYRIELAVSPSSMTANGQNTAAVTVTTYNVIGRAIPADVSLSLSFASTPSVAGTLSASSLTTSSQGTGNVTFDGGLCFTANTATITAMSDGISETAAITLAPAAPPSPSTIGQ